MIPSPACSAPGRQRCARQGIRAHDNHPRRRHLPGRDLPVAHVHRRRQRPALAARIVNRPLAGGRRRQRAHRASAARGPVRGHRRRARPRTPAGAYERERECAPRGARGARCAIAGPALSEERFTAWAQRTLAVPSFASDTAGDGDLGLLVTDVVFSRVRPHFPPRTPPPPPRAPTAPTAPTGLTRGRGGRFPTSLRGSVRRAGRSVTPPLLLPLPMSLLYTCVVQSDAQASRCAPPAPPPEPALRCVCAARAIRCGAHRVTRSRRWSHSPRRGVSAPAQADSTASGTITPRRASGHARPTRPVRPPPPFSPSRTDWTRLIPPPVLTGHVSSLLPY